MIGYHAEIKVSAKVNDQFLLDDTALDPEYSIGSPTGLTPVMVNFMHRCDWATGYPAFILGVCVRMFLDEIKL